jgi:hypothetical protein
MNEKIWLKWHNWQTIVVAILLFISLLNFQWPKFSASLVISMMLGLVILNGNNSEKIKLLNRY